MPKETISNTPNSNTVSVCWGKDRPDIQLVTASPYRLVSSTVERFGYGDYPAKEGAEPVAEGLPFDGWYADLSREEVNRLIRVLRRARDQAFGKDE